MKGLCLSKDNAVRLGEEVEMKKPKVYSFQGNVMPMNQVEKDVKGCLQRRQMIEDLMWKIFAPKLEQKGKFETRDLSGKPGDERYSSGVCQK